MYFVVEVRAGGLTGVTNEGNDVASLHFLSYSYKTLGAVGIARAIVKAMVDLYGLTIALTPPRIDDRTISCSEDIRTYRRREVHAFVETADVIDGVDTPAVAGSHTLEFFVKHGLNSRNILHTGFLFFLRNTSSYERAWT